MRPARPLGVLMAAALAVAGCSTVPSSSPTVPITQVPTRPDTQVGIEPLAPEPGASPEQIVSGFIDAAASTGRNHPVAREHLTPGAAGTWDDAAGITVIEAGFATVTTAAGVVEVTARTVGTVDQRGIFSVGGDVLRREYTAEEVEGEWRIADPPDGLVIVQPDFERVYDQLDAFFLDPAGKRVVPDPRHLIIGTAQPTALVERLLDGPSPRVRAGVRNSLEGLSLRRAVTVEGSTATVDLTGFPAGIDLPLSELCAQLVWTLDQGGVRSVVVMIEGEPVRVPGVPTEQTVDDWAAFAADAVPVEAVGHYVDGGALRTAAEGEPASGPAGEGAYDLTSAAVAADAASGELAFLVGVGPRRGGRTELLSGPYGGRLTTALTGRTFTPPTVAATRSEVWTVRNGTEVVRVPAGATPQTVTATSLRALGTVRQLQLSPDGVRAAMVIRVLDGPALFLGTVVRSDDGAVVLRDLHEVAPDLTGVTDVAWRDSGRLIVLADAPSGEGAVPFELDVDGYALTEVPTSGLPGEPVSVTSVAAVPNREPLVSAAGTIWELIGGNWVTLVRGQEPLPGTEPFFPL